MRGSLPFDLRLLLDETANTAPLHGLPKHLSELLEFRIIIATVWQSLGQIKERYGEAMHAVLAASTTKVFLGPVSDQITLEYLGQVLGNVPTKVDEHSILAPKGSAQDLQQFGERALVLAGKLPPVVVGTSPWWESGDVSGERAALAPE